MDKFGAEVKLREEKEAWAAELVRQLERGKQGSVFLCMEFCGPFCLIFIYFL